MTYFAYGEITLTSEEWIDEYLRHINAFIEHHDGRVLSRSIRMEKVEGTRPLPTNVILVAFPDRERAWAFFEDPDYQPLRRLRVEGSTSDFVGFPAEDLALEWPGRRESES